MYVTLQTCKCEYIRAVLLDTGVELCVDLVAAVGATCCAPMILLCQVPGIIVLFTNPRVACNDSVQANGQQPRSSSIPSSSCKY